jgi:hypothetical protein
VAGLDGAVTLHLPGSVHATWSDASAGDLRPVGSDPEDAADLAAFAVATSAPTGASFDEVAWVTQVHGARVVDVTLPTPTTGPRRVTCTNAGEADALVAGTPGTALCVLTADCGPLALASPEGIFAAVHAGWRGLVAGVVESAVRQMRRRGATEVSGVLGPCIHAGCYEFGTGELDEVAAAYGATVRSTTTAGRPALDLVAGVAAALAAADAPLVEVVDRCTACGGGRFSHRARADTGRQALLVWSTDPGAP